MMFDNLNVFKKSIVKFFKVSILDINFRPHQDPEMILLEDGITLWLQLLENAPCGTPSFVQMFEWLYPLLQLGSDSLKTSLLIIECTILLDPPAIISVS